MLTMNYRASLNACREGRGSCAATHMMRTQVPLRFHSVVRLFRSRSGTLGRLFDDGSDSLWLRHIDGMASPLLLNC